MLSKALLGFSVPDNQSSMTAHYYFVDTSYYNYTIMHILDYNFNIIIIDELNPNLMEGGV